MTLTLALASKPALFGSVAELTADRVNALLDRTLGTLATGSPEHFSAELAAVLHRLREAAGAAWNEVIPWVRRHPAVTIARECPITHHATIWPRGYPGDAGLLDMIYRHPAAALPAPLDDRARRLNTAVHSAAPMRSVRHRRMLLADAIDDAAVTTPGAEILSLACGHLREAEWSAALASGAISRFIAADQDSASLAQLDIDYGDRFPVIAPTPLSVRDVLMGRTAMLGRFDLVYAAGLYDYLPEPVARALTERLFGLLHPGGRLLIGNFGTGIPEAAFMESVMAWPLIWRSAQELAALAAGIAPAAIASQQVWPDITGTCLYLDLRRAGAD